ncbi:hypothetical protein SteCoe_29374 [Stentor coeruleus]|uniref:Uncharacterized protein n=1 Tax=Stentor coeruleus TaxID=5963 RepID=A0A1R2B6D3_9CILI|nr:hypothetical protein SteCoe_29374 [Stentor coeruleus]
MSSPTALPRNVSFTIKRDHSQRKTFSRDRITKDFDDNFFKKRFRLQPYSSFEDKFNEQDRINKYTCESFERIDKRLQDFLGLKEELDRIHGLLLVFDDKIQSLHQENIKTQQSLKDIDTIRDLIQHKNTEDLKAHEKNLIFYEEVLRLSKSHDILAKTITATYKSPEGIRKPYKPQKTSKNTEIEGISNTLSNLTQNLKTNTEALKQIQNINNDLRGDFEAFKSFLTADLAAKVSKLSIEFSEKALFSIENSDKNSLNFNRLIDTYFGTFTEKFSKDVLFIKQNIERIEGIVVQETVKNTKNIRKTIEVLEKKITDTWFEEKKIRENMISLVYGKIDEGQKEIRKGMADIKDLYEEDMKKVFKLIFDENEDRKKAESELKHLIQLTGKTLLDDYKDQSLKIEYVENLVKNLEAVLRNSISEKADLVSRYVDSEILRLTSILTSAKENYTNIIPEIIENKISFVHTTLTQTCTNIAKAIVKLSKTVHEVTISIPEVAKTFDEKVKVLQDITGKLDKKICEMDDVVYKDLEELASFANQLDEDIHDLIEDRHKYLEGINKLESQIDLKVINEKVLREHQMAQFYSNFDLELKSLSFRTSKNTKKIQDLQNLTNQKAQEIIETQKTIKTFNSKIIHLEEKLTENHENTEKALEKLNEIPAIQETLQEISRTFDSLRANIKAEMTEFFEEAQQIKEKVEVNEIIFEEFKEKIRDLEASHAKVNLMLKNTIIKHEEQRYITESQGLLQDLAGRVETMNILSKLDMIFRDMDSNEKETQAMLGLYKKELEFIQERQQKGLEAAQVAVHEIFEKKISDLQNMIVEEMQNVVEYTNSHRLQPPNLSGLQEFTQKLRVYK